MKTLLLVAAGATGAKRCQAALRMKRPHHRQSDPPDLQQERAEQDRAADTAGAIEAVNPTRKLHVSRAAQLSPSVNS
jgi:hypothetical protein